MEKATLNLIEAIDRERTKRKLSDRKFSNQVLGISHSYLSLIKAGKRPLTPNLAVLFMQKLPEITPEVTSFIMSQGDDGENNPEILKTSSHQNNFTENKKTPKKVGVKNRQRYIDASKHLTPPKKPSKNATGG